jgi:DNA repair exonuclease SbcCD ATPase subunit
MQSPDYFGSPNAQRDALDLEGLDHIFKWASEMVADGEDTHVKLAREKRIRRQVLEVVQKVKEQKLLTQANEEISYLQRRVIALLQKLQEITEENTTAKNVVISQYYMLQRIPMLEQEVKQLRGMEYEREGAITERRYLMNALAKVKADRDMLEELLTTSEQENTRLAKILSDTRVELNELKDRRWWHAFFPPKKKAV